MRDGSKKLVIQTILLMIMMMMIMMMMMMMMMMMIIIIIITRRRPYPHHEDVWGRRGLAPVILGTRWSWVMLLPGFEPRTFQRVA
jgi:heme/copper-type cytochrome/quinol oxidase subunit 2